MEFVIFLNKMLEILQYFFRIFYRGQFEFDQLFVEIRMFVESNCNLLHFWEVKLATTNVKFWKEHHFHQKDGICDFFLNKMLEILQHFFRIFYSGQFAVDQLFVQIRMFV